MSDNFNPNPGNPYSTPVAAPPMQMAPARPQTTKEILTSAEGRIPRSIYWKWILILTGILLVIGVVCVVLAGVTESPLAFIPLAIAYIPMVFFAIVLQIKRWHDRGKSGWWCLINLIPYIGGIWVFVEVGCLRGTQGPNKFGPDPLQGR